MGQNRHSVNKQVHIDEFVRQMHLSKKADNPILVLKLVLRWTKGQALLTKKLLQYILQSKQNIPRGKETLAVEKIVRYQLLKEFQQDDLTLEIRRFLYQKKLQNLLKQTKGKILEKEQNYLTALQRELALSNQECLTIKNNIAINERFNRPNHHNTLTDELVQSSETNSYYNEKSSSSLIKESQTSTLLSEADIIKNQKISNKIKRLSKKWWWLLLGFPLLFLLIKGLNWRINYQLNNLSQSLTQQQKLCIDLTSRQSPRMSLGEKILTQEYVNLKPQSKILLYEGSAAFARCEFAKAKENFQQSLILSKNNPEALIYLNKCSAITQDHLKIAVSVPLGSNPEIAWEILRGVAQAQAEINQQGGIRKLLLVQIVNDDNDAEIVREIAQQLAADQSILAVIGHNDSNPSLAGSEIYQKEGLVMISPTSSSSELSNVGSYILRTAFSVAALANTLADYASVSSLSKITICFDSNSSASNSFVQEFSTEMLRDRGQKTAVECDFALEDFDAKQIVKQAIAQNSDAFLLAPSVEDISPAIAIAQANQQQLPLLGNHSLYTSETIKKGQDAVVGMVLPSPWLPNDNSQDKFLQATIKYWGGKVNWRTATAYDATLSIIQGLQQSDTRSQLQSILTQSDFLVNGVTGKFYFEKGDRFGKVELADIEQLDGNSNRIPISQLELEQ